MPYKSIINKPDGNIVTFDNASKESIEYSNNLKIYEQVTARHDKKLERAEKLKKFYVKTKSGNAFDADEISQQRMARFILVMNDNENIPWVLADNTIADVNKAELAEALKLAVFKQSELWIKNLTDQNR